ncbi:hypothetical protein 16Q_093 [Pseudomonas phage 16Q]|nr:hypothetical protein 16Q_093 [Pseudomonas phage 16Q]
MTTRNEPTVGTTYRAWGPFGFLNKPTGLTHDELLKDALGAFTDAQIKLDAAQATIAAQIEADEREVAIRQGKILAATESHSRLERIKARFIDLLS